MRQDSISTHTTAAVGDSGQVSVSAQPHVLTPKEVLSWLPKDATPAQQDSAIQRHIKVSEIHWSEQPDTLHMPGHTKGRSLRDGSLPQYYRESFFSKDSMFHPELSGGRYGVAGDPVPYSIAGDNLITSLLLGCFVLAMISFSRSMQFIIRQGKNFFYVPRGNTSTFAETSGELWVQMFLVVQTCLLFSLIYFFYTRTYIADTFTIEHYQIIGIFTAVMAAYFLVKAAAYWAVGWVFFDRKKNEQWMKTYLYLISMEGVLLFPVVMLLAYFNLPMENAIVYVGIVVVLGKILSFYKTYVIFFRGNGIFLQNFLYFCALEMTPLASLWGVLVIINSFLKVNF